MESIFINSSEVFFDLDKFQNQYFNNNTIDEDYIEVYFIDEFVNFVINKYNINYEYKGVGRPAYDYGMMIKVIIFAFIHNIYSCRQIASAIRNDNTFFLLLSNGKTPSYRKNKLFSI